MQHILLYNCVDTIYHFGLRVTITLVCLTMAMLKISHQGLIPSCINSMSISLFTAVRIYKGFGIRLLPQAIQPFAVMSMAPLAVAFLRSNSKATGWLRRMYFPNCCNRG